MSSLPRPKILNEADLMIKTGLIAQTRDSLQAVSPIHLARADRLDFAKTCRRVGLTTLGLRALKPVVHPDVLSAAPATPHEKAEYAVLLSRVGAIREALKLLGGHDLRALAETSLYEGFAHVSNWNYGKAQVAFETYLKSPRDPYSTLIARVNLAACLVYNESSTARIFLDQTFALSLEISPPPLRLRANCLELRGHANLREGDLAAASRDFTEAAKLFGELKIVDQLLVQKGLALIETRKQNSTEPLVRFRAACLEKASWENCREIDFLLLKESFTVESFIALYFGTPYEGFRSRLVSHFQIPSPDVANLGSGQTGLDLVDHQMPLKIHSLLSALSRDSYAPARTGRLFSEIYPDECFDPQSSPVRIRQLISRTRGWLAENAPDFQIHFRDAGSRLILPGDRSVRVSKEPQETNEEALERSLFAAFSCNPFAAPDACETLEISRMTFLRWVQWAKNQNRIRIAGSGRAVRYQLTAQSSSLTAHSTVA